MKRPIAVTGAVVLALAAACGTAKPDKQPSRASTTTVPLAGLRGQTVTLLTHDAFAVSKGVLEAFTAETGIKVKIVKAGDAGAMVNQAILAKDDPVADALFGVDNTFLTRAIDAGLFAPRDYAGLDALVPDVRRTFAPWAHDVVPLDQGDVCINYDIGYFRSRHLAPPATLDDLTKPAYDDLTVVENPATSSPGLAFVLATIGRFGNQWPAYWKALRANRVLVVDSWDTAYDTDFTAGGAKGTKPIVVSYASSPPADIVFASKPKSVPSVGVMLDGCFRQYELGGVLAHARHPAAAQRLVEFLLSARFQADMPLQMFVWPVRTGVVLPRVFVKWAKLAPNPVVMPPGDITAHRDAWIQQWTDVMTG